MYTPTFTKSALMMLQESYMLPGEEPQDAFKRVSKAYGDNDAHSDRLYSYLCRMWFMPASPVLSNGGTKRGLPISCFLNEVQDSLKSISETWNENVWLSAKGGGIGTYWGNVRSVGEKVGQVGKTSGVQPFIVASNYLSLCISQGDLRRGNAAVYMPVWHPEIEEFIDMRKPHGGDPMRKATFLNNAVVIDDAFMEAVESGSTYNLRSPATGEVIQEIDARNLWIKILSTRVETGEPYLLFIDNVNKQRPLILQRLGIDIKTSNLCSEIVLPTGLDHLGKERTAVCCLSSLNLDTYDEWKDDELFIEDMLRYLDNVLQDFIDRAPDTMARAKYAAERERSIGLGTMGFHSYLQRKQIPFESVLAKIANEKIFRNIRTKVDEANKKLGEEKGPCLDGRDAGIRSRFSHCIAIAPNASSSIICNSVSPGIEPYPANAYIHKTKNGSFEVRNNHLRGLLESLGKDTDEVWQSIHQAAGSVQHLDFLNEWQKATFKTCFEINQEWIIEHAANRQPFIDQAQSVNLFLPADVDKKILHQLHFKAWKMNLKSLYYVRSKSIKRAENLSNDVVVPVNKQQVNESEINGCLACEG